MKSIFNPWGVSVEESAAKRFLPAAVLSGLFGYGAYLLSKTPSFLMAYILLALLFLAILPLERKFYKPFGSKFLIAAGVLFWVGGFLTNVGAPFAFLICLVILRVSQEIFENRPRTYKWIFRTFVFFITQIYIELLYFIISRFPKIFGAIKSRTPLQNLGRNIAAGMVIALICVGFIAIFCGASPQFLAAVKYVCEMLPDFFYNFEDLVHWLILTTMLFGLFSITLHLKLFAPIKPGEPEPGREIFSAWHVKIFSTALALFNAIFLLQNFFDLKYAISGCALPSGTTYAQYALDGAHALALATLMSAAIIMLSFRSGINPKKWRIMRILAYVWIAQNIMLAVSACVRLGAYTSAYSLTTSRIYGFVFFALVFCGFVLAFIKISREKPVRWLVDANIYTVVAMLAVMGLFSHKEFVANYNASRYINSGKQMDWKYMRSLGDAAIPAWIAILKSGKPDAEQRAFAQNILDEKNLAYESLKCAGRYFNYREYKRQKALEAYFRK